MSLISTKFFLKGSNCPGNFSAQYMSGRQICTMQMSQGVFTQIVDYYIFIFIFAPAVRGADFETWSGTEPYKASVDKLW